MREKTRRGSPTEESLQQAMKGRKKWQSRRVAKAILLTLLFLLVAGYLFGTSPIVVPWLKVLGDATIGGSLTSGSVTTTGDQNFSDVLFVDDTNNRVGVLDSSPATPLEVNGIVRASQFEIADGYSYKNNSIAWVTATLNIFNDQTSGDMYIASDGSICLGKTSFNTEPGPVYTCNHAFMNTDSGLTTIGASSHPAAYQLDVQGDSSRVSGRFTVGDWAGSYSYVDEGDAAWTASSDEEIKNIGQEKIITNICDLWKSVEIRQWNFDSSKVNVFDESKIAGFDTMSVAERRRILARFAERAKRLASKTHFTPTAQNWNVIGQHFEGNESEINYTHVIWAQGMAIKKLIERVEEMEKK